MKKSIMIILIILLMLPYFSYADYVIDTSNSIVVNNRIVDTNHYIVKSIGGFIYEEDIIKALDELDFQYNGDFTIHVLDYTAYTGEILGMALPENTIILFDFIPMRLSMITQNVVTHELGHLVYQSLTEEEQYKYKIIRGIPDDWDTYPRTDYVNRPSELFAEDFRVLFGGEDASMGSHFNQELKQPRDVRRLERFIRQFEKEGE